MWDHRARITNVHDGDTVSVFQDEGRHEFADLRIRLFGTFAPELSQPGGKETQAFAAKWVADRSAGDWPFTVLMIRNKKDTDEDTTLGRYVALVTATATGECLNTAVSAFVIVNKYGGGTGSPTA